MKLVNDTDKPLSECSENELLNWLHGLCARLDQYSHALAEQHALGTKFRGHETSVAGVKTEYTNFSVSMDVLD